MDQKIVVKMSLALERACRFVPEDGGTVRKLVAERIVRCAKNHTQTLAGLTEAARQAVADLTVVDPAGQLQSHRTAPCSEVKTDVDLLTEVSQDRSRDLQACYAVLTGLAG
jgi:hypothetical protein